MLPIYDKYEPYIWSSYGLTAVVLIGVLLWSLRRARAVRRELELRDGERLAARGKAG